MLCALAKSFPTLCIHRASLQCESVYVKQGSTTFRAQFSRELFPQGGQSLVSGPFLNFWWPVLTLALSHLGISWGSLSLLLLEWDILRQSQAERGRLCGLGFCAITWREYNTQKSLLVMITQKKIATQADYHSRMWAMFSFLDLVILNVLFSKRNEWISNLINTSINQGLSWIRGDNVS